MRRSSVKAVDAFLKRATCQGGATTSTGAHLCVHTIIIAEWRDGELWITHGGWPVKIILSRLNSLPGVSIALRGDTLKLNGKLWNGDWTKINSRKISIDAVQTSA